MSLWMKFTKRVVWLLDSGSHTCSAKTETRTERHINEHRIALLSWVMMPGNHVSSCSACLTTCQFGQDDLLHDGGQQADVHVSFLQSAELIKTVKKQRLKPEHVLEIFTLCLNRRKKNKMDFRIQLWVKRKKKKPDTAETLMALLHLEWVPCNQLQTDQRVKEFGQTEADICVSVAVGKVCPPHFKMGFDAVKRMEVFHDILKYFLALLDDALCRRQTLVRHKPHNFLVWSPPCESLLTFLSVKAGDVGGRFLVVGWEAFFMLRSLPVLLSSLSPSGSAPNNREADNYNPE